MLVGVAISVTATNLCCAEEIEKGNLLLLFVKPVSRICFIAAKFYAVVLSLVLFMVINIFAFFISQRMLSATASILLASKIFMLVVLVYFLSIGFVFFLGALSSYVFRRNFVADTVSALFLVFLLLFVGLGFVDDGATLRNFYEGVSFGPAFAFLYIFMAVCIVAAFSLLCSLFFGFVPNLVFTFIFLMVGLVWGYMFANFVPEQFMALKSILPDMNYFWIKDIVDYKTKMFIDQTLYTILYTVSYVGFVISITLGLFSFKEINDKGI